MTARLDDEWHETTQLRQLCPSCLEQHMKNAIKSFADAVEALAEAMYE